MSREVRFEWCRDAAQARRLARIFAQNITTSYISHSELQGFRAISPGRWSDDIAQQLEADVVSRVSNPLDAPDDGQTTLAVALIVDAIETGVFLVTFARNSARPFAVLEDMVVLPAARSHGYGSQFLKWIDKECAARGISRMFLESGIENDHAHHFFEREGFQKVSVVMMREF
jgi:GNAT superfamily N-acetyltransferase